MTRLLMTSAAVVAVSTVSAGAVTLMGSGYTATAVYADCATNPGVNPTSPASGVTCGAANRSDLENIELAQTGDSGAPGSTDFYSIGLNGLLVFDIDPGFIGEATAIEVTNVNSGTAESVELYGYVGDDSIDFETDFTFLGKIDSDDSAPSRLNTFTLTFEEFGPFSRLAFVDVSPDSADGFDIDAFDLVPGSASTEIPLPASVLFLLSGLGALAAMRRRRA